MNNLNKISAGDIPQPTRYRKRRASLLIATTPVLYYVNGSMQPVILDEIVPYFKQKKKGQCDGKES